MVYDMTTDSYLDGDNISIECSNFDASSLSHNLPPISMPHDLTLFHLNIRSLVQHFEDFGNYLAVTNVQFHLIALSEIWFKDSTNARRFQLPHYAMVHKQGIIMNYGGVALYIHESCNFKERDDIVTM